MDQAGRVLGDKMSKPERQFLALSLRAAEEADVYGLKLARGRSGSLSATFIRRPFPKGKPVDSVGEPTHGSPTPQPDTYSVVDRRAKSKQTKKKATVGQTKGNKLDARPPRPTSPTEPAKPKPEPKVKPKVDKNSLSATGGLGGKRAERSPPAWSRTPSPTSSHPSKYTASDCGSERGSVVDEDDPMGAWPLPSRTPACTSAHDPTSTSHQHWKDVPQLEPPLRPRIPIPLGMCPECRVEFGHKPDCSKNPANK
tara:strand:- start:91 stop:852 length:762 start_codon:yes stop_codon:yes gene_type:complete